MLEKKRLLQESEQMMSKLIEAEQKVKNLEPTRQQNRGLSNENKAINTYVLRNFSIYAVLINNVVRVWSDFFFFQGLCGRKAEIESREVKISRYAAQKVVRKIK